MRTNYRVCACREVLLCSKHFNYALPATQMFYITTDHSCASPQSLFTKLTLSFKLFVWRETVSDLVELGTVRVAKKYGN